MSAKTDFIITKIIDLDEVASQAFEDEELSIYKRVIEMINEWSRQLVKAELEEWEADQVPAYTRPRVVDTEQP